jgi:hypothetical protein
MIGLPNQAELNSFYCNLCQSSVCASHIAAARLKPGQVVCVRSDGLVRPYFGIILEWPSIGVQHYFTSVMIEASASGYAAHACVDVNTVTVLPLTLTEAGGFKLIMQEMINRAHELGLMQLEHPPEWASKYNYPQGPRWIDG